MSKSVRAIPEGYHNVIPYLTCRNTAQAIEFYKSAFGATEVMRMAGPDGKIGHAELKIGDSHIFLSDEIPGMNAAPTPGVKNACGVFLYLENVDDAFKRAVAKGAKVEMPLENQFWGDRYGKITDPFGHNWGLSQHVEDVAPAEMERRSKEWQAKMAKAAGAGKT